MYHYTESGLDNIYLVNGYEFHETPYGTGVSIRDTSGLHRTIGKWLISLPKPLAGAEVRFLRIEMDLSQKRLGALIGTGEQAVRRWERDRTKAIPGTADRLIRIVYDEYVGGDGSVRQLIDRLSELDQIESAQAKLRQEDHDWKIAA